MAKKKRKKGFFRNLYDIKGAIGYAHIKSGFTILTDAASTVVSGIKGKSYERESFEEAAERLELTEADLKEMQEGHYRNFIVYFIVGTCFAFYSLNRFYVLHWSAGFVAFVLTVLIYIFAVRSGFWSFQIKHRKLGCTFREWYDNQLSKE